MISGRIFGFFAICYLVLSFWFSLHFRTICCHKQFLPFFWAYLFFAPLWIALIAIRGVFFYDLDTLYDLAWLFWKFFRFSTICGYTQFPFFPGIVIFGSSLDDCYSNQMCFCYEPETIYYFAWHFEISFWDNTICFYTQFPFFFGHDGFWPFLGQLL